MKPEKQFEENKAASIEMVQLDSTFNNTSQSVGTPLDKLNLISSNQVNNLINETPKLLADPNPSIGDRVIASVRNNYGGLIFIGCLTGMALFFTGGTALPLILGVAGGVAVISIAYGIYTDESIIEAKKQDLIKESSNFADNINQKQPLSNKEICLYPTEQPVPPIFQIALFYVLNEIRPTVRTMLDILQTGLKRNISQPDGFSALITHAKHNLLAIFDTDKKQDDTNAMHIAEIVCYINRKLKLPKSSLMTTHNLLPDSQIKEFNKVIKESRRRDEKEYEMGLSMLIHMTKIIVTEAETALSIEKILIQPDDEAGIVLSVKDLEISDQFLQDFYIASAGWNKKIEVKQNEK